MRVSFLYPISKISLPFVIGGIKNSVRRGEHCLDLAGKPCISKILCARHRINKEIFRLMPGIRHQAFHICPVRSQIPTGRQEISEIIQAILKCMPCCNRSHRKSGKCTMITACFQFFWGNSFCECAVSSLHGRDQVIYQFVMVIVRQLKCKTVICAVIGIFIIVSRASSPSSSESS